MHDDASKKRYVQGMFNAIAHRYDFLNHFLSLGTDYYWRRKAISILNTQPNATILDIATGTGDLALTALRLKPRFIIGVDLAQNMLVHFNAKLESLDNGQTNNDVIHVVCGDVENLSLRDNFFDGAMVAFGVRNFSNPLVGLREMSRVLKPGGKIVVLEFSKPRAFLIKQLYFFYFKYILPLIGRMFSRHRDAYSYLPNSVSQFPDGDAFVELLRQAGFASIQTKPLTFGIVTVYSGVKFRV
jgi:demethylmenaquinone methyltransferase/2-methoxy-6-polyprenyl-1,4-benzoquinol methylase